jgi:hypothetical protein
LKKVDARKPSDALIDAPAQRIIGIVIVVRPRVKIPMDAALGGDKQATS